MSNDENATNASTAPDAAVEMTAEVVAAYVSNNSVPIADLPGLIASVHAAVSGLGEAAQEAAVAAPLQPPVPIKRSVQPDHIVCLEDGKRFKSLKRHLSTAFGMTPAQYRAKWGLPNDYPMVAPNYAQSRSELAKGMGLGRKAGDTRAAQAEAPAPAPAPEAQPAAAAPAAPAPTRRGRKPDAQKAAA